SEVRPEKLADLEPVAGGHLDRRQFHLQRDAEGKCLSAAVERTLSRLLELRRAHLEVVVLILRDVHASAEQRIRVIAEDGVEGLLGRELFVAPHHERTERQIRGLSRCRTSGERREGQRGGDRVEAAHFAIPRPRSELRASIMPYP